MQTNLHNALTPRETRMSTHNIPLRCRCGEVRGTALDKVRCLRLTSGGMHRWYTDLSLPVRNPMRCSALCAPISIPNMPLAN